MFPSGYALSEFDCISVHKSSRYESGPIANHMLCTEGNLLMPHDQLHMIEHSGINHDRYCSELAHCQLEHRNDGATLADTLTRWVLGEIHLAKACLVDLRKQPHTAPDHKANAHAHRIS